MPYQERLPSSRNMLKMSTIGQNARVPTFVKVVDSFVIVICGKSSQICCFYNVNKHVGYDMTSFADSANLKVKF